jgi:hypothetical protein
MEVGRKGEGDDMRGETHGGNIFLSGKSGDGQILQVLFFPKHMHATKRNSSSFSVQ